MEDTSCRRFFMDADSATYHRQYEALRAIFIDGIRQDDVADRYGYTHGSMRQLVHQFRTAIRSGSTPPFFRSRRSAGRLSRSRSRSLATSAEPSRRRCPELLVPGDDGAVGDPRRGRLCLLAAAGAARLRRPGQAGRLSRLRHGPGHLGPAEPAGPKIDRQRTAQSHQRLQFRRGPGALRRLEYPPQGDLRHRLFVPHASARINGSCSPDGSPGSCRGWIPSRTHSAWTSTPMPHRGEDNGLENHYVPMRGKAVPSILTFFAQAVKSRLLCYSDATVIRDQAAGQLLKFVEFCRSILGADPAWVYFDSRLTTYAEMSRLNAPRQDLVHHHPTARQPNPPRAWPTSRTPHGDAP